MANEEDDFPSRTALSVVSLRALLQPAFSSDFVRSFPEVHPFGFNAGPPTGLNRPDDFFMTDFALELLCAGRKRIDQTTEC